MKFDGVILYGPPASGKDTITAELCKLDGAYSYFEKLKVGEGRTYGYRMVTEEHLVSLREHGLIVHEATRYGATYAVDASALGALFEDGRIPVVHMGQISGVHAVKQFGRSWLDVLLWCSKDATRERLRQRGSVDTDDRLAVWNATLADVQSRAEPPFTLSIRTDSITPPVTAALIHTAVNAGELGG